MTPNEEARVKLENAPDMPDWLPSIWEVFCDLHNRRIYTMDGPQRHTWAEIDAYQSVMRRVLSWFDLQMVFALEDEFFKFKASKQKKP